MAIKQYYKPASYNDGRKQFDPDKFIKVRPRETSENSIFISKAMLLSGFALFLATCSRGNLGNILKSDDGSSNVAASAKADVPAREVDSAMPKIVIHEPAPGIQVVDPAASEIKSQYICGRGGVVLGEETVGNGSTYMVLSENGADVYYQSGTHCTNLAGINARCTAYRPSFDCDTALVVANRVEMNHPYLSEAQSKHLGDLEFICTSGRATYNHSKANTRS